MQSIEQHYYRETEEQNSNGCKLLAKKDAMLDSLDARERSYYNSANQGRPVGVVEYQYTRKKNRQNTPKYPKFLQIYPKIIKIFPICQLDRFVLAYKQRVNSHIFACLKKNSLISLNNCSARENIDSLQCFLQGQGQGY